MVNAVIHEFPRQRQGTSLCSAEKCENNSSVHEHNFCCKTFDNTSATYLQKQFKKNMTRGVKNVQGKCVFCTFSASSILRTSNCASQDLTPALSESHNTGSATSTLQDGRLPAAVLECVVIVDGFGLFWSLCCFRCFFFCTPRCLFGAWTQNKYNQLEIGQGNKHIPEIWDR